MTIESYDLWLNDLENFDMTLSFANTGWSIGDSTIFEKRKRKIFTYS